MTDLRSQLYKIGEQFVSSVLAAMGTASLADLASTAEGSPNVRAAATPGRPRSGDSAPKATGGRRHRASPEEVQKQKDLALATAKTLKADFSKGDIMRKSGSSVDLGRALSLLVGEGKLKKKGDRRKTRYWLK